MHIISNNAACPQNHLDEWRAPVHAAHDAACLSSSCGWAGHLVALAALLVQPKPQSLAMLEVVADLHRYGRSDPREAIDHGADQRPVAQPN